MAEQSDGGVAIDETTNTVVIDRSYPAGVDRTWFAWTDPEAISRWWGPQGWTTTVYEMDVRPGGRWRFAIAPDDGSADPIRIAAQYTEVVRLQRLAYQDTFADTDWEPEGPDVFSTVVTFAPTSSGSRVRLEAGFPDGAALRRAVELGMVAGYAEALGRLESVLAVG